MPQDKELQILLLEKITEVSERTARMEVEQSHMKSALEEVQKQDIEQNKLLADHIQGVKTANARLDNEIEVRQKLESRVVSLEEGPKFRATAKQYLVGIGAIAAALVAILKLMKFLGL